MFIRRGNIERIKTLEKKAELNEVIKEQKVIAEVKEEEKEVLPKEEEKVEKKKTKKSKKK